MPVSAYSSLLTHNWWKVPNDDKIEPPIQVL